MATALLWQELSETKARVSIRDFTPADFRVINRYRKWERGVRKFINITTARLKSQQEAAK